MSLTVGELEVIVEAFLVEGVPPGIIARVFNLEDQLVKEAQRKVRVQRYGTEDLMEFTEQLQWDAIDEARKVIISGAAVEKTRFIAAILGKQISLSARRTPDATRRATADVLDLFAKMREERSGPQEPEDDEHSFVATTGGTE